jgi:hypothetical protein
VYTENPLPRAAMFMHRQFYLLHGRWKWISRTSWNWSVELIPMRAKIIKDNVCVCARVCVCVCVCVYVAQIRCTTLVFHSLVARSIVW